MGKDSSGARADILGRPRMQAANTQMAGLVERRGWGGPPPPTDSAASALPGAFPHWAAPGGFHLPGGLHRRFNSLDCAWPRQKQRFYTPLYHLPVRTSPLFVHCTPIDWARTARSAFRQTPSNNPSSP